MCRRAHCDPEVVGQLCCQDGLCVHENCLYHASGLSQRGADEEGFYGFLLPDIWQELERVAQKRCCICRLRGASVTCQRRRCPRSFHFPCGRERGCVSQFFGEFKSFCWKHRPVQRVRAVQQEQTACLVCREVVARRPRYDTLVCPTCASAWFHRCCIQGQALRSALHHFRCPLCQDVDAFQEEMFRLGIKIPDRDAAWEEDGSFADHHVRHSSCDASQCLCPVGREEAEEKGPWRLLLCSSCGSCGTHQLCSAVGEDTDSWECGDCSDTGTGEGCSWGDRVPRATWPPQPAGIWGQVQGCDPRREGLWHGLVVSSSPCPLQCPPLQPSQTPAPQLRDPRTVPRLLALWLRKKRLGSSKDTPTANCPLSPCPTNVLIFHNKRFFHNFPSVVVSAQLVTKHHEAARSLLLPGPGGMRRKNKEKLVGQDKDREGSLTSYGHGQKTGSSQGRNKINVIYYKSNQNKDTEK
uniref:PHD finger protein 7 n=1 Tax=Aquila chrysaetos chrysaetos TaxID=223781 RepID=A0A663E466_AQUCH